MISFGLGFIVLGIIIPILILLVIYIVIAYNNLVKARNRVGTQWAQIDVQLTRRADLIPNLVEAVKVYAAHEKEVFEGIASARKALEDASSPGQAISANDRLSGQLLPLFAVAEAYPALKADSSFIALQLSLQEAEEKIAYARQFYNDTVLIYKDRLDQFPSSIIAKLFSFKDELYFMPTEDKRADMKLSFQ
jgi:LemA protein